MKVHLYFGHGLGGAFTFFQAFLGKTFPVDQYVWKGPPTSNVALPMFLSKDFSGQKAERRKWKVNEMHAT